ncbi:glucose dehydrogenase [FAD, quinone]-like [Leguminivora glycinivorella]|uniref:glucose dehydrogenase [FAD, quinone]-like n=1 Tax=Leguminivora glycinivorella TaxID=1035111 RepID=UPI00200C5F54|nr:glucose dehydrogenase [FAD, quinone]-like [Leguminivora glycinivorella]
MSAILGRPDYLACTAIGNAMKTSSFVPLLLSAIAYFNFFKYDVKDPEGCIPGIDESNLLFEYDFIIVGAGSAGSVVANRLSEKNWKILLLEAGGDETEISDIPLLAGYLQKSELDWKYTTEPNENYCLALEGGRCCWPRGKVLGGCSVLNYMLYLRGNRRDYDTWQSLGNKGWGYDDVLYYFKKSEDNQNPSLADTDYHGKGGYLTVSEAPYHTPLVEGFIEAGKELGYENRDINGQKQTGFMIAQGTVRNGSRCSTAKAFLRPAKNRPNLHISLSSFVTKVLIDPVTKIAFGVEFVKNNKIHRVRARKEVILSAGSINSAQLLMLSGIGPSEELTKHQIPVIQNLKVGYNLQDHVAAGGVDFLLQKNAHEAVDVECGSLDTSLNYAVNGTGPLTSLGGVEGLAFVNTKYANASEDYPDIEFHFLTRATSSDKGKIFRLIQGITDDFYDAVWAPVTKPTWSIMPMLLRPYSLGRIQLRSADPYDPPLIYPNYFTDENDMDIKTLVEGVKIVYALSKTKAMQYFESKFNPNIFPACKNVPRFSDAFWECMIRQFTVTVYHPVGTAKMGPYWDPDAVVDDELRVYGVKGLRVVDGSIMPLMVSGNTNAPIIMIGEKGSDMIKEYWLKEGKHRY